MVVRVRKQDSAYLYQLLESYEGLVSYSTLPVQKEFAFRDIALLVPPGQQEEVAKLIDRIATEIPLERRSAE